MYLKSIEIHGFKSFANKIKFDFHNGITGIVGPNGSGKSNVADAVRWVLGEQRAKQLRGSSMQDVIFAGTQNRRPQSYASVSITLDNSDHKLPVEYEEVTVTRRVFRSGESEYLINNVACRLKDISELFYDTGIGKEGYSIIGQGQIDSILSGKPEERRALFDEAAGIVKYKRRKTATQKKLASEQANLVRVNDILGEVEKQLGPLERQSQVAKKYLATRNQLETYEVNMFLYEMDHINKQLESVQAKAKIVQNDFDKTGEELDGIKDQYNRMEQELADADQQITKTRDEISNTSLVKGKLEGQINLLEEQIRSATTNDQLYKERLEALQKQKSESEMEKAKFLEEQESVLAQLEVTNRQGQEAADQLVEIQKKIHACKAGIDRCKSELIDMLKRKASIKNQQQRYDTMVEQVNIRKSQLNQRLLQKKSDELSMDQTLEEQQKRLEEATYEMNEQLVLLKNLDDQLSNWNEKQRKTISDREDQSVIYHKEHSRLESLENISERYDGYGNSIRKVMEQKNANPGIIGVIADIIKVDKKYEEAIETALGGNIQNIVTKDEGVAKDMIQFLKRNRGGRATFLPLTTVTPKIDDKTQKALKEDGVLGRADQLVQVDTAYSKVIEFLLCRVIVVENIDRGLEIAKKYHYGLRIVTLDGESLNYGGSLTGGAFKNSNNLLSRSREMDELKKKLAALEKTRLALDQRLEEISTAKAFVKEDQKAINARLSELQIIQNTAKMQVENANNQKRESDRLYADLSREKREIEDQLKELIGDKERAQGSLEEVEHKEKTINKELLDLQEQLDQQMNHEENQAKLVSSLQMEVAACNQKVEFVTSNVERMDRDIAKRTEDIEDVYNNELASQEDVEAKKASIKQITDTIAAGDSTYAKLNQELKAAIAKKEQLNLEHKDFFAKREALSKQQGTLDKELFRLNGQMEKLNDSITYQTNHIWEEYELTLHHAMKLKNENYNNPSEMKRSIAELREVIRKLGDVNVSSIAEYKELSERYSFMNGQREDLIRAEASLEEIIVDLDEGMRKQFTEKFELIKKEYDQVFKELFGGGKGTLQLPEGEDVLECGILIAAQPPGKKLQNIMALSGGEKALTAIALLFAIQNLKPSPFCLLDEIEAALDDSNVNRFAKYLNKLTQNTQFIIITHRRGTMTAADRLYGITMQEKGVSALVSVDLIEKSLDK